MAKTIIEKRERSGGGLPAGTVSSRPKQVSPARETSKPAPFAVRIVLGICLAGLLTHIALYSFQCDDAFISFRYARNLADGDGLVFNPGHERVEGYTNFLWVLILAAGSWVGMPPESLASPLSILFSLGLAAWLLWFCDRNRPGGVSPWWLVVPAVFLAANRSYAVWSTSGLETKLFELLAVGGVICTLGEMRAMREGRDGFPYSALLLALATLTRPDGLLISACVIGTRILLQVIDRTIRLRPLAVGTLVFAGLVGGHFLFRHWYYGDWLPNTYYAKVSGQTWWEMGGKYLAGFALEYGLVFWLPVLIAAAVGLYRVGRLDILLIILAATIPHAIYIAAIGGDHFEYRPLDVYVPLLLIWLFYASTMARTRPASVGLTAYLALCWAVSLAIPTLTRVNFPDDYRAGFAGITPRDDGRKELIDSAAHPNLFRLPFVGGYLHLYNDVMRDMSRHFVGLRKEEHALFLATAKKQGEWLRELVDSGKLPRDVHIAVACVGAIPYFSGVRTLDRLGLTDREVAHRPAPEGKVRIMAHDKAADPEYAVERGVDLWAADTVHLILPLGHPELFHFAYLSKKGIMAPLIADAGEGRFILAFAMQGMDVLQRRCPALRFMPASEYLEIEAAANGRRFRPIPREKQLDIPYDIHFAVLGHKMITKYGDLEGGKRHLERAIATNPKNAEAQRLLEAISYRPK
jgi:arabinofuranosyltransferase